MIEQDAVIEILRRLFHGGVMRRLPKKRGDAEVVMALSLIGLTRDGIFDESEINIHLSRWLEDIASSTGFDYVTLRRYLVDYGFLRRASDGVVYRIQTERIDEVISPGSKSIEPKSIFDEVQAAREERRRQFQQR